MAIMDRLTDKPEWHRKVFDDAIVSKWKDEALAVPDEEWTKVITAPESGRDVPRKRTVYVDGQSQVVEITAPKVVGVMSEQAFDYVSPSLLCTMRCVLTMFLPVYPGVAQQGLLLREDRCGADT